MPDKTVQEAAEEYITANKMHFNDTHEEVIVCNAFIAGAQSRDEEITKLHSVISSLRDEIAELEKENDNEGWY